MFHSSKRSQRTTANCTLLNVRLITVGITNAAIVGAKNIGWVPRMLSTSVVSLKGPSIGPYGKLLLISTSRFCSVYLPKFPTYKPRHRSSSSRFRGVKNFGRTTEAVFIGSIGILSMFCQEVPVCPVAHKSMWLATSEVWRDGHRPFLCVRPGFRRGKSNLFRYLTFSVDHRNL